ncbi:hypothetical protein ED21_18982 [Erythrobacter sp. SD-21]|nr:hypothetical protein ED21_18982 [Erythrobacter sp. SD-21]
MAQGSAHHGVIKFFPIQPVVENPGDQIDPCAIVEAKEDGSTFLSIICSGFDTLAADLEEILCVLQFIFNSFVQDIAPSDFSRVAARY